MTTETVSLVFTDLVGSTELMSRLGPEAAEAFRREHFELLRSTVDFHGAREVKNLGDGLMIAAPSATQAVACAVAMLQAVDAHNRRSPYPAAIRVGVSAGDAEADRGDYFGPPVVEAARLCAAAGADEIYATDLVRTLVGGRGGHVFEPVGELLLKGLPEPITTHRVCWEPLPEPSALTETSVPTILTPDQRLRVFVSSTLEEAAEERAAVRAAIDGLHLTPVMFEPGGSPHPPRALYRSYLEQSHVFVGVYLSRYGWVAPNMDVSGLEDEYRLSASLPRLLYVKRVPEREPRLDDLLDRISAQGDASYKPFTTAEELRRLVADDLAILLTERFHEPRDAPPVDSPQPEPAPLPVEPTPFVGRERELHELQELLRSGEGRLLTLTGPGGIGKTRLALRAIADLGSGFPGGTWFVSFASVRDPGLLTATIASGLGVRAVGAGSLIDAIAERCGPEPTLVVLDNLEHVAAGADAIAEILQRAPACTILATSRHALRLHAEREYPVPAMRVPAPRAPLDARLRSDSVALFADRAAANRHGFVVDRHNIDVVAAICERVDGLPLAIELAAARVRVLAPEALLERLSASLDVLAGGARDLPDRQRTIRSTIDWSYRLLEPPEQHVLAQLSVFRGRFTLDAAEHVVGVEGIDVLDALASLVDKSLIRIEPGSEPRFRLLELIREYARERLHDSGIHDEVAERHARYYRELSIVANAGLHGPEQGRWLAKLTGYGEDAGEKGNFRAAFSWFVTHGRLEEASDMGWSLALLAWIAGTLDEGRQWGRFVLDTPGDLSPLGRARVLACVGIFAAWKDAYDEAAPALEEALRLGRSLANDGVIGHALLGLGLVAAGARDSEARTLLGECVEVFRRAGDAWGEITASALLGWLAVETARPDEQYDFAGTLHSARALGDDVTLALAELNAGRDALGRGSIDEAAPLLTDALRRFRAVRAAYMTSYGLEAAAQLAAADGRADRAALLLGAADRLRDTIGVPVWACARPAHEALRARVRDALGAAAFDEQFSSGGALRFDVAIQAAIGIASRDTVTAAP